MVLADNRVRVLLYMVKFEAKYKSMQAQLKHVITNHCVGSHQQIECS
jgi:hypothetical protein